MDHIVLLLLTSVRPLLAISIKKLLGLFLKLKLSQPNWKFLYRSYTSYISKHCSMTLLLYQKDEPEILYSNGKSPARMTLKTSTQTQPKNSQLPMSIVHIVFKGTLKVPGIPKMMVLYVSRHLRKVKGFKETKEKKKLFLVFRWKAKSCLANNEISIPLGSLPISQF